MMSRAEKRYLWTEDIMAWGHGQYTREELNKLAMPELFEIHNRVYIQRIGEMH